MHDPFRLTIAASLVAALSSSACLERAGTREAWSVGTDHVMPSRSDAGAKSGEDSGRAARDEAATEPAPQAAASDDAVDAASSAPALDASRPSHHEDEEPDDDAVPSKVDAGGTAPTPDASSAPTPDAGSAQLDPYAVAARCSSGQYWKGGDEESPLMRPGGTCIQCHAKGEGPRFSIAGTLYATAHEPNDCNGASSAGARIVIEDAQGVSHTLTPNAAGNFYSSEPIALPYRGKIVFEGRTLTMESEQTDGDCNGCHTQLGANDALGRLLLP